MAYAVELTHDALAELERLSSKNQARLLNKIRWLRDLQANNRSTLHRCKGEAFGSNSMEDPQNYCRMLRPYQLTGMLISRELP